MAVIGSLLNTSYQDTMTASLAPFHVPQAALEQILGSIGGALAVAARLGGTLGAQLSDLARTAFADGMDLGLSIGAVVALCGCLIALAALPSRPSRNERRH